MLRAGHGCRPVRKPTVRVPHRSGAISIALDSMRTRLRSCWQRAVVDADPALRMALLKNAQAALIDASAGAVTGTNLTRGFEWGSEWGEVVRTDFENETLLQPELRRRDPHAQRAIYRDLHVRTAWRYSGRVLSPQRCRRGDVDDGLLVYVRYDRQTLLVAHNSIRCALIRRICDWITSTPSPFLQHS